MTSPLYHHVVGGDSDEDTHIRVLHFHRGKPGILELFPSGFQQPSLLGIHPERFPW